MNPRPSAIDYLCRSIYNVKPIYLDVTCKIIGEYLGHPEKGISFMNFETLNCICGEKIYIFFFINNNNRILNCIDIYSSRISSTFVAIVFLPPSENRLFNLGHRNTL